MNSLGVNRDKWENPYIKKLDDVKESVFDFGNGEPGSAQIVKLKERTFKYKKVICEIGSGSGMHLIELARRNPNNIYIGFELRFKRAYRTIEKAIQSSVSNLLVVRGKAEYIPKIFNRRELSGVYINFPDPWQKSRWKKHRMINSNYLFALSRTVKREGFFSFKTDHKEYFESSCKLINSTDYLTVKEETRDLYSSDYEVNNIKTEFEGLFLSKSMPIYYLKAEFS